MNLKEWLKQGFEYEQWATGHWRDAYPQMPEPRHAEEILGHLLWALEIWLSRVDPEFKVQEEPYDQRLESVCQGWIGAVSSRELDEVIDYRNTKGVPYKRQLGAIALHVINHGTYHRGQLRGLAAEQGFDEFPETDLIGFFIKDDLYGADSKG